MRTGRWRPGRECSGMSARRCGEGRVLFFSCKGEVPEERGDSACDPDLPSPAQLADVDQGREAPPRADDLVRSFAEAVRPIAGIPIPSGWQDPRPATRRLPARGQRPRPGGAGRVNPGRRAGADGRPARTRPWPAPTTARPLRCDYVPGTKRWAAAAEHCDGRTVRLYRHPLTGITRRCSASACRPRRRQPADVLPPVGDDDLAAAVHTEAHRLLDRARWASTPLAAGRVRRHRALHAGACRSDLPRGPAGHQAAGTATSGPTRRRPGLVAEMTTGDAGRRSISRPVDASDGRGTCGG